MQDNQKNEWVIQSLYGVIFAWIKQDHVLRAKFLFYPITPGK